jgi:hypothetical protein
MTKEDINCRRKELFNLIKDKPVRWCNWDEDEYFVPRELLKGSLIMKGDSYYKAGVLQSKTATWYLDGHESLPIHKLRWKIDYNILAKLEIDKLLED